MLFLQLWGHLLAVRHFVTRLTAVVAGDDNLQKGRKNLVLWGWEWGLELAFYKHLVEFWIQPYPIHR